MSQREQESIFETSMLSPRPVDIRSKYAAPQLSACSSSSLASLPLPPSLLPLSLLFFYLQRVHQVMLAMTCMFQNSAERDQQLADPFLIVCLLYFLLLLLLWHFALQWSACLLHFVTVSSATVFKTSVIL